MDKLDTIARDIAAINVTLAKQAVVLEDHTRRSTSNERRVDLLEAFVTKVQANLTGLKWLGAATVGAVGLAKTLGLF
jgi:hypothetical protein